MGVGGRTGGERMGRVEGRRGEGTSFLALRSSSSGELQNSHGCAHSIWDFEARSLLCVGRDSIYAEHYIRGYKCDFLSPS